MTTNAADNLLCKQDDDRQNDISQGPAALEKLLGWRVNLKQLALAALAYQTTRTLQLVRRRQQAMPAATTMKSRFDFSRLPEEVFDLILEEARLAAIDHATSNNPVFDSQLACSCTRAPPPAVQFHVYTDMDDRRGIGRFGSHSPHRGNLFEHNLDMSHNYRHVPPKPDICRTEGKCLRAIRADLKVLVSSLTSSPESSLKESKVCLSYIVQEACRFHSLRYWLTYMVDLSRQIARSKPVCSTSARRCWNFACGDIPSCQCRARRPTR